MSNNKPVNTATPIGQLPPAVLQKLKVARKFEIFVEEFDEEKEPGVWKPVRTDPALGGSGGNPVITVSSPAELQEKQNFYHTVGQRFRIVREIDPPSQDELFRLAREQGLIDSASDSLKTPESVSTNSQVPVQSPEQQQPPVQTQQSVQIRHAIKPKIVTIGDMQIKYDGEKVYQKQWCRLSPAEAENFRIVNSQTNKIVPLSGKHIEARRWVLIEDQSDDTQDDTEKLING